MTKVKVKIKQLTDFTRARTKLKVGDEVEVSKVSPRKERDGKETNHYLIESKTGKPTTFYPDEVEVLPN